MMGEQKAMKSLGASLCVHVINGWVQGVEASFSCCTNSSSNLASYSLQQSFCVDSSARDTACYFIGIIVSM